MFTSSFINEFQFFGFGFQVYALALPHEGIASFVYSKINFSHIALVVTMVLLVIPLVFFVSSMITNAQREICLHDKLIKQMEATQQAERKSMNKSLALVGASHDIRAALAGITGFIDLCLANAAPRSDFKTYLKQMSLCAQDLLGKFISLAYWYQNFGQSNLNSCIYKLQGY